MFAVLHIVIMQTFQSRGVSENALPSFPDSSHRTPPAPPQRQATRKKKRKVVSLHHFQLKFPYIQHDLYIVLYVHVYTCVQCILVYPARPYKKK